MRLFPEFSLARMAEDRFSPGYTRKLTTKLTTLGFSVGDMHFKRLIILPWLWAKKKYSLMHL